MGDRCVRTCEKGAAKRKSIILEAISRSGEIEERQVLLDIKLVKRRIRGNGTSSTLRPVPARPRALEPAGARRESIAHRISEPPPESEFLGGNGHPVCGEEPPGLEMVEFLKEHEIGH